MATYRYPVLIWEDAGEHFTAAIVDAEDEMASFGHSPQDCLGQLKKYLQWLSTKWDLEEPALQDPKLLTLAVDVRPGYQRDGRFFPCPERVRLRIPCVWGRLESGGLLACLPTFNIRFQYQEEKELKELTTHYVRSNLEGAPTAYVARHLPPADASLHELSVVVRPRSDGKHDGPPAPTLAEVAEPLAGRRARSSKAWGRDETVRELRRRLQHERAPQLLLGESGCGKTTVVIETARRLLVSQRAAAPPSGPDRVRKTSRLWLTSASRLIAGMKYLGQWEERCEEVIAELDATGGVLCVENLLELVRVGGTGPQSGIAAFFLPYLTRGELRLVAEATPAELAACRRLLPGLADVFHVLPVPEFGRSQAVQSLTQLGEALSRERRVEIANDVMPMVYRLFRRFLPYSAFPGKAATFVHELVEDVRRKKRVVGRPQVKPAVQIEDAIYLFVRQTGLPEVFVRDDRVLEYAGVLEAFAARVIGQDEACGIAADVVTTFKAGMNDPERPLAVLLFCGPTGVGKTQMAKEMARYFFRHGEGEDAGDGGDRLLRLDMSEYAGPSAADRLLKTPQGTPSAWIQRIRQQPFVVVLFDEIEKAAPEVFDTLLGVFDEGRLVDAYGRETTFRSAVIIMTSNLGTERQATVGFSEDTKISYISEAMQFFRPEFFNRLDAVVTFQPLTDDVILRITRKELAEVELREGLLRTRLRLTWGDRLIGHIAREGFDRRYGARPLQRTIEGLVVTPLARYLVENPGTDAGELFADYVEGEGTSFRRRGDPR